MGTRPQTMYGLNDSPVFLAAYMLDHDPISYATLIAPAFLDGDEGGLTPDDMLDNITMFWLTNTGVSTAKSYWEYLGYGSFANARNVTIPVAVSVFPDELFRAPWSWTEQAYPNLVHYNEVDRAGTSPPGSSRSCTPPLRGRLPLASLNHRVQEGGARPARAALSLLVARREVRGLRMGHGRDGRVNRKRTLSARSSRASPSGRADAHVRLVLP